MLMQ
ncbi:MAG: hypothetical protein EZS28_043192, partial [Streblomastix strix]|jgi:hypothetical protein